MNHIIVMKVKSLHIHIDIVAGTLLYSTASHQLTPITDVRDFTRFEERTEFPILKRGTGD